MSKKNKPTITVQHKIQRPRPPKHIAIQVKLEATGESRQLAYLGYENELRKLNAIVDGLGDLVVSSAPKVPSERVFEEDNGRRTSSTTKLAGEATIQLLPAADFGALICGLVEAGLKFENPSVEYETASDVPAEVYEELAASARAKAEATASGAGCSLGSVVEITFPKAEAFSSNSKLRWLWDRPRTTWYRPVDWWWSSSNFMRSREPELPSLDTAVYDLLDAEIMSYTDEISISIVYELDVA
ncbi:MAG: SIMPL domain-containing protein [Actinomycetota bacterium]